MSDRNAVFCGDNGAGKSGINISDNEDQIGIEITADFLESDHYPGGLFGVSPRPNAQIHIRLRQSQVIEKDLRHRFIVVLAGMNQ